MYFQKLKIKFIYFYSFLLFTIFLPQIILAQNPTGTSITLTNYLKVDSISDLLVAILNILIIIATPIIIFFIIYGGYLYVTSRGNPEQIKTATSALTYAVIGGVLIIGAVAIGEIIKNIVEAFKA